MSYLVKEHFDLKLAYDYDVHGHWHPSRIFSLPPLDYTRGFDSTQESTSHVAKMCPDNLGAFNATDCYSGLERKSECIKVTRSVTPRMTILKTWLWMKRWLIESLRESSHLPRISSARWCACVSKSPTNTDVTALIHFRSCSSSKKHHSTLPFISSSEFNFSYYFVSFDESSSDDEMKLRTNFFCTRLFFHSFG